MTDILERLDSFGADYPVGSVRDAATDATAEIRRLSASIQQQYDFINKLKKTIVRKSEALSVVADPAMWLSHHNTMAPPYMPEHKWLGTR